MSYNQQLADRLTKYLSSFGEEITQKEQDGLLFFLRRGLVACGIEENKMFVRIAEPMYTTCLEEDAYTVFSYVGFSGEHFSDFLLLATEKTDLDEEFALFVLLGVSCTNQVVEDK